MKKKRQLMDEREPNWWQPFLRFVDYIYDVDEMMQLAKIGIGRLESMPELLRHFFPAKDSETEPDEDEVWIKPHEDRAELAKSEIERDFPLLHGHALVGMWGALEGLVEDAAVGWLDSHPEILQDPSIAKIRLPLAEYEALDRQDRLRFIVSELQRDLKTDLKSGATKFEPLLAVLGLDGPVDGRVRQVLYEAQQLRNVIAHRGGVADRKFVNACPQLGYTIGDPIMLTGTGMVRIMDGLLIYATTVANRCRKAEGWPPIIAEPTGYEGSLTKLSDSV